ncbi:hypothetical protein JEZ94_32655, partial [Pseudomonas aeruginosa]|nr:hypothetical protein [Pseudomonas aeruginosa]
MGLFNAHAVAQQRADRIATLLQSFADGQLDTALGAVSYKQQTLPTIEF